MKKVEQINKQGKVVLDFDVPIKNIEIISLLKKYCIVKNNKNPFSVIYKKKKIIIHIKSITYLGNPHPIHKKRIQIPKKWKNTLQKQNSFLLGAYKYKKNIIFVLFDVHKYKNNRLNNSSAHIHTIDLVKAIEDGIFQKIDARKNFITVFTANNFLKVFDNIIFQLPMPVSKKIKLFDIFSTSIKKEWDGIECYKEMISSKFEDAFQAEWAGFYLEYSFNRFLNNNKEYKVICVYQKKKKVGETDLDLKFCDKSFGDLKMHDNKSGAILGNDKKTINDILRNGKKLWYIIFCHDTVKDKDFELKVTEYWNLKLIERGAKKDLHSYEKRMKNSVILTQMIIAEINDFNKCYLSDFFQGRNSGGGDRKLKIKINKKDIDNFVIHRKSFIS